MGEPAERFVSSPHRYCQNPLQRRQISSCFEFQALIGTAKTLARTLPRRRPRPVSSPHRYCQNTTSSRNLCSASWVSSPHRYCQNSNHQVRSLFEGSFQALIGTAKTWASARRTRASRAMFQALIGTAKTVFLRGPFDVLLPDQARFKPS